MPGSIIGWMSMVCVGYLVGARVVKEDLRFFSVINPFIVISVSLGLWVYYKNYQNSFSHELLSDYFQSSSINTVPILLVCSANLYCAMYYYMSFSIKEKNILGFTLERKLLYFLCATAILTVVAFEFRSGLGIFVLSILVVWSSLGSRCRYAKYPLMFLGVGVIITLAGDSIYSAFVELIVPGRKDIASIVTELTEGATRYDKMVYFWEIAGFSKMNFAAWSEHFSFSGMSDLVAALFPISLVFFVPALSLFKLLKYASPSHRVPVIIILISALSSLLISILQPDFYSMFTFFAIVSLVHYGEKSKKKDKSSIRRFNVNR